MASMTPRQHAKVAVNIGSDSRPIWVSNDALDKYMAGADRMSKLGKLDEQAAEEDLRKLIFSARKDPRFVIGRPDGRFFRRCGKLCADCVEAKYVEPDDCSKRFVAHRRHLCGIHRGIDDGHVLELFKD